MKDGVPAFPTTQKLMNDGFPDARKQVCLGTR